MSWHDVFYNSKPFDLNITISDDVAINAVIVGRWLRVKERFINGEELDIVYASIFNDK